VLHPQSNFTEETTNWAHEGIIKLGKKLINPYSVENMQKAYQNLKNNGSLKSEIKIKTTHYYVRFSPNSFDELAILQNDTTLELFDYPLDYELEEGGTFYHDPSVPINEITWQYCAVESDYEFPNIKYEILEKLYLPKNNKTKALGKDAEQDIDMLIKESLTITGNIKASGDAPTTQSVNYWHPRGTIKVWDGDMGTTIYANEIFDHWEYVPCDGVSAQKNMQVNIVKPGELCREAVFRIEYDTINGQWVPVAGCKVRAYSWFQVQYDLTDANGYFYISENFTGTVNYSIKWERNDFDIRSDNWGQAYYNGPQLEEQPWTLNIDSGGMSWVYAHIHRGAYTYYYANEWGIKSPPKNDGHGFLAQRIHLGAMNNEGRSHYYDFNALITLPQIKIYRANSHGVIQSSIDLFGTTIHEFAHASHWEIGYSTGQYIVDAIFSSPYLPESWAVGVEATITSDIYNNEYGQWQDIKLNNSLIIGGYTPIVWDMWDDYDQRAEEGDDSYPADSVSGYTLKQLEDALYGIRDWDEWQGNIFELYSNPTKNYLAQLFNNYPN
jgi:hypothetical protein